MLKQEWDSVKIYWDDASENGSDVLTGYYDFEGYKIYKSLDGGSTWGSASDRIYDADGLFVGWRPYKQFDLSAEGRFITLCLFKQLRL